MKTFVIGDIHGAYLALQQVLARCNFKPLEDRLIFLGDYVDGWSQGVEVLLFLADLKSKSPNHIFLEGNHDSWLKIWLNTGESDFVWERNGGYKTILAFERNYARNNAEIGDFVNNLKPYHMEDKNLFVHAGFNCKKGANHDGDLAHFWDREFWKGIYEGDALITKKSLSLYNEVYIGHTPTTNFTDQNGNISDKPIYKANVTNMDTGAGWGYRLSCLNIETKDVFQSDLTRDLYPDEDGR